MVFGHRHHILGPCLFKQVGPFFRVKLIPGKEGNQVFITKLGMFTIGLDVMLKFRRILDVHVPGIPFVAEGRNRIDTPMDEDAELTVFEPLRNLILA